MTGNEPNDPGNYWTGLQLYATVTDPNWHVPLGLRVADSTNRHYTLYRNDVGLSYWETDSGEMFTLDALSSERFGYRLVDYGPFFFTPRKATHD